MALLTTNLPATGALRLPKLSSLMAEWIAVARQRRALARLDARLLSDVGLSRDHVAEELARPFWDARQGRHG